MSSDAEERAALQSHPIIAADATGVTGVFRLAITATSQGVLVPKEMRGRWLDLYASGAVQYGFQVGGAAAGTLTYDELAALGVGDVNAGFDIPAGGSKSGRIPSSGTDNVWLLWRGPAIAGNLVGFISDKP